MQYVNRSRGYTENVPKFKEEGSHGVWVEPGYEDHRESASVVVVNCGSCLFLSTFLAKKAWAHATKVTESGLWQHTRDFAK